MIMEKGNRLSNYEKMKNDMSASFLQYDQQTMIQKFALEHNETYIYICFFSRNYRIERSNGRITWSKDSFITEEVANYNEVMTIYDVLCYSKENCHLSHQWVNVASLSSIKGGTLTKEDNFFQNAGKNFSGKLHFLENACKMLHGRKQSKGDIAYELDMFVFLPVLVRFWEKDDEFPASLQILVDQNILDYMHYETVMFAISHMLNVLKSEIPSQT